MGRLSDLVRRAIESRRDMLNRGRSVSSVFGRSVHALPPLLSCDFRLRFEGIPWGADSTNFMLTDLNLGDSGLSWAPHASMETVPMPTVSQSYFTIQFYVSSDAELSPSSFPTLYLYEKQFTPNGLLRLPETRRQSQSLSSEIELQKTYDMAAYDSAQGAVADLASQGYLSGVKANEILDYYDTVHKEAFNGARVMVSDYDRSLVSGWSRPTILLYAVYPAGVTSDMEQTIELCRFEKCVFGTPRQQFAVGQTAGMTWSQQIGFRRISWGEAGGGGHTGTFSQRSAVYRDVLTSGIDMVK